MTEPTGHVERFRAFSPSAEDEALAQELYEAFVEATPRARGSEEEWRFQGQFKRMGFHGIVHLVRQREDRLRAEIEALRKAPSVEELAEALCTVAERKRLDTAAVAGKAGSSTDWRYLARHEQQPYHDIASAVLRALGRDAG